MQQMCQCPESGKPHFYRLMKSGSGAESGSCQCPESGKPHFYKYRERGTYTRYGVSMP